MSRHMSEPSFRPPVSDPAPRSRVARADHAWQAAFETHYVGLCEYVLRRVGSGEAAQDIVHDLLLRRWDARGSRDWARLSRPSLYVAARTGALKYLRRRRVAQAWIDRVSHEEAPLSDTPEDLCLRRELDDAVRRAIAGLPHRCREIFVLRRRDQLGYREIALRLGVSLGTVKSQMWRAAGRLEKKLGPPPPPRAPPPNRPRPRPVAGGRRRCGPHGSRRRPCWWSPAPPSGRTVRRLHRRVSTLRRPGTGRRSRCPTAPACCSASARDSWCRATMASWCAPWSSKAKRTSSYGTIRRVPSSFAPPMVRPRILAPSSTFVPTVRSSPCRSSWPPAGWRCGAARRPIRCCCCGRVSAA